MGLVRRNLLKVYGGYFDEVFMSRHLFYVLTLLIHVLMRYAY
jgi:hypothetical protein